MRKITEEELKEILKQHRLWLDSDEKEGKQADLSYDNLAYAKLSGAILRRANLDGVNFSYSDLSGANLSGADLINSELEYADLTDTILDEKEQCRKGIVLTESIAGYKKAYEDKIITLKIPVGAKVFSINNNKRRTNKVKVIDMQGETELSSIHDNDFKYHVGDEIEITNFDERYNAECSTGIHFFLTREEAEKYIY
jgi:hypothetical protein